ncbi:pilus assembly protein TadG-related protein [Myxococcaceae bacterium GXIMD 01537]
MRATFSSRRGQTLLIFALSLLLLVLLVCMALSTGMKVKEKMEVQSVADAAAFSNATATARTFNEVALMQRGMIGQMVAMASVQSLISWSGYYRTEIEATRTAYAVIMGEYGLIAAACCIPKSPCMPMCKCALKAIRDANKTRGDLRKYQNEFNSKWDNPDKAAAKQVLALQGAASTMMHRNHQMGRYRYLRNTVLKGQGLAGQVVEAASEGSKWKEEWSAPGSRALELINIQREASVQTAEEQLRMNHINAAMGSRGATFTTSRGSKAAGILSLRLNTKMPKPDYAVLTDKGSGYWASSKSHGKNPTGAYAWADDHGGSTVFFLRNQAPCPPMVGYGSADAHVRSTDRNDSSDQHKWKPGNDQEPASQRHTLGKCNECPGMWPGFVDHDLGRLTNADDNFGQPKNFALIQRDYSVRGDKADPWNLTFRFRFTPKNPEINFSNAGLRLSEQNGGLDINKQSALAAGIAYYHRMGHWKEPPNFFNPYWRATLVPATIDASGKSDVTQALNGSGLNWAGQAWEALSSQGYKGGP